jgi:hypothetical protein
MERQAPTRDDLGEEAFATLVSNLIRALASGIVYTANDFAEMCAAGAEAYEAAWNILAAYKAIEAFDKLTDPALVAAKQAAPLLDDQLLFALMHSRRVLQDRNGG